MLTWKLTTTRYTGYLLQSDLLLKQFWVTMKFAAILTILCGTILNGDAFTPLNVPRNVNNFMPSELQSSNLSDDTNGPKESLPTRRQTIELAVAALGLGTSFAATRENKPTDYGLYGVLPIGPYKTKTAIMDEIVPGKIWTVDQKFGILNVQVPVRMTIVKVSTGGLFIYDPIAATPEVVSYVRELEKEHGKVKHVVLGSVAIEHKVYAGVFAQKFPTAQVWLQDGQYSFPNDLPPSFLGFPGGRTNLMPSSMKDAPADWSDFEFETLGPSK